MCRPIFTLSIALICFSCGNSNKKEKETTTINSNTTIHGDTDSQRPIAETPPPVPDSTKTVNLTFEGYDEGDYAHLIFKDGSTDYDFGHPEDNVLNNIPVVIKDNNTSFGYKENTKMKGAKFVAELVYKMTDTYGDDGQPKKAKEWRITSLKKAE